MRDFAFYQECLRMNHRRRLEWSEMEMYAPHLPTWSSIWAMKRIVLSKKVDWILLWWRIAAIRSRLSLGRQGGLREWCSLRLRLRMVEWRSYLRWRRRRVSSRQLSRSWRRKSSFSYQHTTTIFQRLHRVRIWMRASFRRPGSCSWWLVARLNRHQRLTVPRSSFQSHRLALVNVKWTKVSAQILPSSNISPHAALLMTETINRKSVLIRSVNTIMQNWQTKIFTSRLHLPGKSWRNSKVQLPQAQISTPKHFTSGTRAVRNWTKTARRRVTIGFSFRHSNLMLTNRQHFTVKVCSKITKDWTYSIPYKTVENLWRQKWDKSIKTAKMKPSLLNWHNNIPSKSSITWASRNDQAS